MYLFISIDEYSKKEVLATFHALWPSAVLFQANWTMRPIEQTAICFSKHLQKQKPGSAS